MVDFDDDLDDLDDREYADYLAELDEDDPAPEWWEYFSGPPGEEEVDSEELCKWFEDLICRRVWHYFHLQPAIPSDRVSVLESRCPGYSQDDSTANGFVEVEMPAGNDWYDLGKAVEQMLPDVAEQIYLRIRDRVEDLRLEGYRVFWFADRLHGEVTTSRFLGELCLGVQAHMKYFVRVVGKDSLDRILGDKSVKSVDEDPFGHYFIKDDYDED